MQRQLIDLNTFVFFLNNKDSEFQKKHRDKLRAGDQYAIGFTLAYQTVRRHIQLLHKEVKRIERAFTALKGIKKLCNNRECGSCIYHQNENCIFADAGLNTPKTWKQN